MHIALVSPSWPMHLHPNGIVTYLTQLRQELVRRGEQVSVVAGLAPDDLDDPSVHKVGIPLWFKAKRRLVSLVGMEEGSEVFSYGAAIAATIKDLHRSRPIDVIEMEESFGWFA